MRKRRNIRNLHSSVAMYQRGRKIINYILLRWWWSDHRYRVIAPSRYRLFCTCSALFEKKMAIAFSCYDLSIIKGSLRRHSTIASSSSCHRAIAIALSYHHANVIVPSRHRHIAPWRHRSIHRPKCHVVNFEFTGWV